MTKSPITVTDQTSLDQAIADKTATIYIDSPSGVWLTLTSSDSSRVVARGSSSVVAWGSSRVVARDSSSVVARDSSSVVAGVSSSVVAWGSSRVVARGSSRVVAWDSSSVVAWGSSSVVARDSSSVDARGSSSVVARGSSRVVASKYVAVHLWSARVALTGDGHIIDLTNLDLTDRDQWLDYHGVPVADGSVVLYKAVDVDNRAGHEYTLTQYTPGQTVVAPDWEPTKRCGQGLHFGITPTGAACYYTGPGTPRYLACRVNLADLVVLGDKCKASSCAVLHEVDVHGDQLATVGAA